jgi:hypothetical protein
MKTLLRRLDQLETLSAPKVNHRMRQLADELGERRRRRLEASGQPPEEELDWASLNLPAGRRLTSAETLRMALRLKRDRARGGIGRPVQGECLTHHISRRLERLETSFPPPIRQPIVFRVLLVQPENGVTEVLVIEGDKPTLRVPPTPAEVEKVRADLERRRASRLSWNAGAN